MNDLTWLSLRGGLNDTDPPLAIADDQCTVANNVEFDRSMLGERRRGCTSVSLPSAITGDANIQVVSFLYRHLPTTSETDAELIALGQNLTTQNVTLQRKTTSWNTITPHATDLIDVTSGRGYQVAAQTLHGKLFLAYKSTNSSDRLHVWDGSNLRRTGLAEPAAPTGANTGAGSFSGTRYYRVRMTVQSGGVTLRRSEFSDVLTFAPSGTGTGVVVTKPATVEDATHWELEASLNNADFRVIATTAVGTTTVTDSTAFATGYGAFTLSEDAGDYSLQHSCKFLSADEDRLILGGSWEDSALASRFAWTPVFKDPTGVGNDERIPTDTTNFLDLDGFAGGPLTHISQPVNGYVWAFKWSHIYRMERTDVRTKAYNPRNITKSMGAIPGSVCEGVDQYGRPCLYFLDPRVGPCRIGVNHTVVTCGRDIQKGTWSTVNLDATIVARCVFYADKKQVHWWIATSGNSFPNKKIVLQCSETRDFPDGVRKGWSTADGKISRVYTACMFAEDIDNNDARSLVLKPFIGVATADGHVLRCDTGDDDNGTDYSARIVTKPLSPRGLLKKFGTTAGALMAVADASAQVIVRVIRDMGTAETADAKGTAVLAATGSETHVIKLLDSLEMDGCRMVQIEFEDAASPVNNWELVRFDLAVREEEDVA